MVTGPGQGLAVAVVEVSIGNAVFLKISIKITCGTVPEEDVSHVA